MKNMNEIRRNIRAVEETRQITNAMYLLSTSRMKKAVAATEHNRMYMHRIRATVKDILNKSPDVQHRYLKNASDKRAAFIVIASDKGLAGAYNSNIINRAMAEFAKHDKIYVSTVGIMATEGLHNRGVNIDYEWFGASQKPTLYYARQIAEHFINLYRQDEVDQVYVIYTHFHTTLWQSVRCRRLLPLSLDDLYDEKIEYKYNADIIYQPSIKEVFDVMAPQYLIGLIYGCLNQASASEHVERMNAMQSATNNADEMIKKLSLEYNAARQLAITNEITEIASAAEAIKNKAI